MMILKLVIPVTNKLSLCDAHFRLYNLNWFSPEFVAQEGVYEVFGFYNLKRKNKERALQSELLIVFILYNPNR
jgi:hypothetical protein